MPRIITIYACLNKIVGRRGDHPQQGGELASVITLYWCPRVWIYLNATQHELSSKCEH